ncbi:hypothetical protein F8M41_007014 [Gigaspora margarita]|uniref:Uncharacterized protein n=1 Tax=Gigaspora margarita TaxID=4874 RepID=A0A8H4B4C5_GIGMA|nr:hypothetical protein F8M41_007014 [Gigaspora margarita]
MSNQNYPQRTRKKTVYLEVDPPGAGTSVIVPKDQSCIISNLNIPIKPWLLRLTVTEVPDAYYDINETVGKPFNDIIFGFNKKQENELEVLLKEVFTECNILYKNWYLKRRNLSKNSEVELILEKAKMKK